MSLDIELPSPSRSASTQSLKVALKFPMLAVLALGECVMRALSVLPGVANSMRLDEVAEPPRSDGDLLVETLAIGVCRTDREIAAGEYGRAPQGAERLIIG